LALAEKSCLSSGWRSIFGGSDHVRIKSLAAAFAILFTHAAATAVSPPPLMMPTGPWNVEFADKMCLLSRHYGKDGVTQLMLKPDIVGSGMEIIVSNTASSIRGPDIGNAAVAIAGHNLRPDPLFSAYSTRKARLIRIAIPDDKVELSALRGTITIDAKTEGRHSFSVADIELAAPVLANCIAQLRAAYKVSEAEVGTLATKPKAKGSLFSFDDYPAEALRRGQSGTARVLVWVEVDGRASTCEVTESSASPILDQATCNIMRRARFTPATNAAGKDVRAPIFTSISWVMPSS
jgi:TonB family protein